GHAQPRPARAVAAARGAQAGERLDAPHRELVRPGDESLARPLVPVAARDGQGEGERAGADRRERDPPLLGARAVRDAAPRALEPRGALRRARRHAVLAGRSAPRSDRLEVVESETCRAREVRAAGRRGAGAPPAEARRQTRAVRAAGRRGAWAPPAEARLQTKGTRIEGHR